MNAPVSHRALAAATPTLDALTGSAPATPPQDWQQLVSEGHVLGKRALKTGLFVFPVALVIFVAVGLHALHVAAGIAGFSLPLPRLPLPMVSYSVPTWVRETLIYNPDTYTDLQGGVKTSYRYAWLAKFPHSRGINPQAWTDLVNAVSTDLRVNRLDTDKWTAVPALATAPKVTRPQKALTEHLARLDTGIVTVSSSEAEPRVHVLAMVDGNWAWVTFAPYGPQWGCRQSFGPSLFPKCIQTSAIPEINDLRPASN